MTREMARLLISPTNAWPRLRQDYDHHPFAFLVPLLLLPLLPAACLFIGTTQVGWSLPGNDSVQHLSSGSALLLATMCYLGFVAGVVIMGLFVRWVLFRTPSRPSVPGSLTFTTAIAVPLMLAGIVALVPWRILLLLAAAAACAYSVRLLFTGLPLFMRMQERQTLFYAFCILGVGFLTLLTTAFIFIEFWGAKPGRQRRVPALRLSRPSACRSGTGTTLPGRTAWPAWATVPPRLRSFPRSRWPGPSSAAGPGP